MGDDPTTDHDPPTPTAAYGSDPNPNPVGTPIGFHVKQAVRTTTRSDFRYRRGAEWSPKS
ncbi:hypothetical protein CH253_26290 [Rhodococcus sp. 06-156-3C]|nr:hypothetical protein CH253_26290 [Rhodococcus sp. 06-156-3C]OZD20827.1 hypothetical protein CH248_11165 [Rhodococcus sp. 06-156-4a]OZD29002.1 hypothetical protein CH247_18760 [Rhodococcus sp. 06-156-3b]OZD33559.1 hypothetical protein CH284_18230 [Rhodococcus sp. 06-156-3]OZF58803.1 hypothetical protein CH290_23060 [Rhodococcus sp. 06-156-4]